MKASIKDILREITHSLGRFLSILLIVAIGTAFFAGVKASVPDMKNSADDYFDKQNLMDIRLMSTLGFSEDDVSAIKKIENIKGLNATYSMDFLADKGTSQLVVKTIAWQDLKTNDPNYMNQVRLIDGRLPKKENECLIEADHLKINNYEIGDTITLKSGNSDSIDSFLKQTTFKIVGTCYTPDYLSYEKGSSTIGSGSVDTFIMIPKSNYISEYYTEILISVNNAKAINTYSEDYFDVIDPVVKALENTGTKRSDIRNEEIKKIANDKWTENYQLYIDNKKIFEDEIAKAENDLANAETELAQGQLELDNSKKTFNTTLIDSNNKIAEAEATLATSEQQVAQLITQQQSVQKQYDDFMLTYDTNVATATQSIKQLEALRDAATTDSEKIAYQTQIDAINVNLQQLYNGKAQLENALSTLNANVTTYSAQLQAGKDELNKQKIALEQGKLTAEQQFKDGEQKLINARQQIDSGRIELEKNKETGQTELDIASENLEAAKGQLNDLPEASWYVLDRNSHYSYRDYESVADRMDGIAKVFPVFFLIVAALVCLTTMTRMVDEQRNVIGTYKALGYSKVMIAAKYLTYALIAGIIGSILGCLIGMHLFPTVIFNAWNLMYNLPGLVFTPQIPLAFISSLCVVGVTLIAAGFACYKELVEVPASLMRPKTPKTGKKILLERITFIWSHFSFTMKVTARNIFRYKKRFFMTVIGISGCTALLLAGFGIKDSIAQIVDIQYEEITQYDAMIKLDSNASLKERLHVIEELEEYKENKGVLALTTLNASVDLDNNTQSITLMIPDDTDQLDDYISLRTRRGKEPLTLGDDGAIISEKLAKNLNASIGDNINILFDDDIERSVKISAITENYVGHIIYMTPSYYKELTSQRISENTVLLKMKNANDKTETTLGNHFVKNENISSITFYRGVADSFSDTIDSISFITYVLIGAAGLLAFVVLYNLTNVNISERLREIATIKVLGFYDLEVASYVYRENIFLTLIGSFVGLALGIVLHQLIMNLAEMPDVMFGRNINMMSFIISIAITSLFGLIVNVAMYTKLKNIPMVESLKSVE